MTRSCLIVLLAMVVLSAGCSKEQEELDAIQQDATTDEATAVMDSLEGTGAKEQPETSGYAEPEPAAEPEPEPDYSDITGFVVQIGSYTNYELASAMAEKYQNRDLPAFLREVEIDGRVYYRLRIGVYETYAEAKTVGEFLVDRYSATYWIDNNR